MLEIEYNAATAPSPAAAGQQNFPTVLCVTSASPASNGRAVEPLLLALHLCKSLQNTASQLCCSFLHSFLASSLTFWHILRPFVILSFRSCSAQAPQGRDRLCSPPSFLSTHVTVPTERVGSPLDCRSMVSTAPAWEEAIECKFEQGSHLQVWLSNQTVCCISPEGSQSKVHWYHSQTGLPLSSPPFVLNYSLQASSYCGLAEAVSSSPEPPSLAKAVLLAPLGVLVPLTVLGWVSASSSYWLSVSWVAAACVLSSSLGGPTRTSSTLQLRLHGLSEGPAADQLQEQQQEGAAASRRGSFQATRALPGLEGGQLQQPDPNLGVVEQVDPAHLETMQRAFPDYDKALLARFLISRKANVDAATAMCKTYQALRARLDPIQNSALLPFMALDFCHMLGFARDGTPVLLCKMKNLCKEDTLEPIQKLVLRTVDLAALISPKQQSLTIITDFSGFSMSKNVDFARLKQSVQALNSALPEVLRRVFAVNTPFVFQAFWGMVQVLLEEGTKDKVRILGSCRNSSELKAFIDPDVLPEAYGGNAADAYDASSNSEEHINWGSVPVPEGF
mmetsp:Transcript_34024/g.96385  ORF Transcript_34024/g.96385 Transcript_34024/m.96385 type:complete len:562 (-) Transcript_34024:623-2308(-)